MTVKEKIFELNADFQKAYYDKDLGFFDRTIPEKLKAIKEFITLVIDEQHSLWLTIQEHLEFIDYELENCKTIAKMSKPLNRVKDNFIIASKRNVSTSLWGFEASLWRYNEKLLNQTLS
jgi:hypothetical protein